MQNKFISDKYELSFVPFSDVVGNKVTSYSCLTQVRRSEQESGV